MLSKDTSTAWINQHQRKGRPGEDDAAQTADVGKEKLNENQSDQRIRGRPEQGPALVTLIFISFLLCHVRGLGRVVFSWSSFSLVLTDPYGRGGVRGRGYCLTIAGKMRKASPQQSRAHIGGRPRCRSPERSRSSRCGRARAAQGASSPAGRRRPGSPIRRWRTADRPPS